MINPNDMTPREREIVTRHIVKLWDIAEEFARRLGWSVYSGERGSRVEYWAERLEDAHRYLAEMEEVEGNDY